MPNIEQPSDPRLASLNDNVSSEPSKAASAAIFLKVIQESAKQREKFLQLEFKALKAYECSLNIAKPPKGLDERLRDEIARVLADVQMTELATQINQDPPVTDFLRYMLILAQSSLVDALPPRIQPRVIEEFRSSMGMDQNPDAVDISVSRIIMHITDITEKVIEFGAPTRAESTRQELQKQCEAILKHTPNTGDAIANAFRFIFASIKQLHEDVAAYALLMVSDDLKINAVKYIREFITTCLPPPSAWKSTIDFVSKYYNMEEVTEWVHSPRTENVTALSDKEHRLKGALLFGSLDLLRSGGRNGSNRWSLLPQEAFYFDKKVIFEAANAVQESTLLILLEGAVSSIFKGKGGSSANRTRMLYSLHRKIISLFSQDIRLEDLQREILIFIHTLLASEENKNTMLSIEEEEMVKSTIEKMADTEGPLYMSFEQKVLLFVSKTLRQELNIPPIGLVSASLTATTHLLKQGLTFNWEVFSPYYLEILPTIIADAPIKDF